MLTYDFKTRMEVHQTLFSLLRMRIVDPENERRWSDSEIEIAVNMALTSWTSAVSLPAEYTLPAESGEGPIELPWYINGIEAVWSEYQPIRVANVGDIWNYHSLTLPPGVENASITFPLLNMECSYHGASITVAEDFDTTGSILVLDVVDGTVPRQGVLRILNGWFAYVRSDLSDTQVTVEVLKSLPIGQVEPGTITAGTSVLTGIFVTDMRLWNHLYSHAAQTLHSMFAAHGSPTAIENHQWYMRWHDALQKELWGNYKPRQGQARLILK